MQTLIEHIKTNTFKPVYLLYGNERYLVTLYRNKLKDAILAGDDGMNFNSFEGKAIDWNEVIGIAETLPFFSDRRLILFDNTGIFKSSSNFADYLPNMPESTCLVFCETEVDKRSTMYREVAKLGYACELNGPEENDLRIFIASRLKKDGKNITRNDADYLLDIAGADMLNISNELEKLIAYTTGRDVVTRADIDAVCVQQISVKIFQLTEAIGMKNKKLALSHYNTMILMREKPLVILFQIIRHFNYLLQTSELLARGSNNNMIASSLGIKAFVAGKYVSQCKNFTRQTLLDAIRYGTELETQVKTGQINEKIAIEFLLVKLIAM